MELTREQIERRRKDEVVLRTSDLLDTIDALQARLDTATMDALRAAADVSWRPGNAPLTAERAKSINRILSLTPARVRIEASIREREVRKREADWLIAHAPGRLPSAVTEHLAELDAEIAKLGEELERVR